jgi:hypothetical protein
MMTGVSLLPAGYSPVMLLAAAQKALEPLAKWYDEAFNVLTNALSAVFDPSMVRGSPQTRARALHRLGTRKWRSLGAFEPGSPSRSSVDGAAPVNLVDRKQRQKRRPDYTVQPDR